MAAKANNFASQPLPMETVAPQPPTMEIDKLRLNHASSMNKLYISKFKNSRKISVRTMESCVIQHSGKRKSLIFYHYCLSSCFCLIYLYLPFTSLWQYILYKLGLCRYLIVRSNTLFTYFRKFILYI